MESEDVMTPPETPRSKRPSEGTKALKFSEKIKNYATAVATVLPVIAALTLGIVNQFKGEPQAELAYARLSKQTSKMVDNMDALQLRLAHLEGYEAGVKAGKIEAELEELRRRYDARDNKPAKTDVVNSCPTGKVADVTGKCHPVPSAVVVKVLDDQKKAEALAKKLSEEQRQRMLLEKKKVEQKQTQSYRKLEKLPLDLEEKQ